MFIDNTCRDQYKYNFHKFTGLKRAKTWKLKPRSSPIDWNDKWEIDIISKKARHYMFTDK